MFRVAFSVGMKGEADRSSTSAVSTDVSRAFSLLANPMEELSTCKQPAWMLPCQRERELQNLVQRQQSNSVTPHCMISVRQGQWVPAARGTEAFRLVEGSSSDAASETTELIHQG